MFIWQLAVATAVALGLIKLGALSVWVSVLSIVVKVMLIAIFTTALYCGVSYVWRRYKVPE
jgi:hypothetical protein